MMTFQEFSPELQNILLNNHYYNLKWVFSIAIIFLSLYYILVIWKNQTPTKSFSKLILRLVLIGLSYTIVLSIPYQILILTPEVPFLEYYTLFMSIWTGFVAFFGFFIAVDLYRYGIPVLLKLGGLNLRDSNANEIANDIKTFRHFYKFNKRRKKFKNG